MPIPRSEREVYANNPLTSVICQVRFPPILRINVELPAAFQEQIREIYPNFSEEDLVSIADGGSDMELAQRLGMDFTPKVNKSYKFTSANGKWNVVLTNFFFAVETSDYKSWEEFREYFNTPFEALKKIYRPAYFTRVGLRYVDLIVREKIGLNGVPWTELLNPNLIGILQGGVFSENEIRHFVGDTVISLEENGGLFRLRFGIGKVETEPHMSCLIDGDFFLEGQTTGGNVVEILNEYNVHAGNLFRWSVQSRLKQALGTDGG